MTSAASAYCPKTIAPIEARVIKKFSSKILPWAMFLQVSHRIFHPTVKYAPAKSAYAAMSAGVSVYVSPNSV